VGADALARIVNVREQRFGENIRSLVAQQKPVAGTTQAEADRRLCCPFCATGMKSVNYGGDSTIFVDRCPRCRGLWLERDELEMVQSLMERWEDEAPAQIRAIARELEESRRHAERRAAGAFQGSRFAFVNAVINRLLDAA
jgi:Zn-finger nucleic acid-binding protein